MKVILSYISYMEHVSKITTKGQITLPAAWRKMTAASRVVMRERNGLLEISPLMIVEKRKQSTEYTVFDAIRDNKGKGIAAKDLVKLLKKIK